MINIINNKVLKYFVIFIFFNKVVLNKNTISDINKIYTVSKFLDTKFIRRSYKMRIQKNQKRSNSNSLNCNNHSLVNINIS